MSKQQREYYTVEYRSVSPSGDELDGWEHIGLQSYCRGADLGKEWTDPENLKEYLELYTENITVSPYDASRSEYRIVKVKVDIEEYWRWAEIRLTKEAVKGRGRDKR